MAETSNNSPRKSEIRRVRSELLVDPVLQKHLAAEWEDRKNKTSQLEEGRIKAAEMNQKLAEYGLPPETQSILSRAMLKGGVPVEALRDMSAEKLKKLLRGIGPKRAAQIHAKTREPELKVAE